jgi:hypothetical protein
VGFDATREAAVVILIWEGALAYFGTTMEVQEE